MKSYGYTSAQLGGEMGEAFAALFRKPKRVPWFWEKNPDCVYF